MLFDNKKIFNLDELNRIIVVEDSNTYETIMIHERLINNNYVEINRWKTMINWYKNIDKKAIITKLHIFQVQNADGGFNAWYDYINDKFVIPLNKYDELYTGINNEYIDKYNAIIGIINIKSDFEIDDIISYNSNINNEKMLYSFEVSDGKYFVVINTDGTIKGNKVFKGSSLFSIRESINLLDYHSLDEFLKRKKELCNIIKKERKKIYYNNIMEKNDSPYMDSEIIKVLKYKK